MSWILAISLALGAATASQQVRDHLQVRHAAQGRYQVHLLDLGDRGRPPPAKKHAGRSSSDLNVTVHCFNKTMSLLPCDAPVGVQVAFATVIKPGAEKDAARPVMVQMADKSTQYGKSLFKAKHQKIVYPFFIGSSLAIRGVEETVAEELRLAGLFPGTAEVQAYEVLWRKNRDCSMVCQAGKDEDAASWLAVAQVYGSRWQTKVLVAGTRGAGCSLFCEEDD